MHAEGYQKATLIDAALTEHYADHMWVGDPLADAAMQDVTSPGRQGGGALDRRVTATNATGCSGATSGDAPHRRHESPGRGMR